MKRRIAVVGCGHVGIVTAASFAEAGNEVICIDSNPARVAQLRDDVMPMEEPGLAQLWRRARASGWLTLITAAMDVRRTDFIFLCVDTPETPSGAANLSNVRQAAERIGRALAGETTLPIIVTKSTSPIGTADTIELILRRACSGQQPVVVANPEFLREGHAVEDFAHPDRIVIGAEQAADAEQVASLYRDMGINASVPVVITTVRTAELIKYVSNAFLATRVSFVNEIARLCERLGVGIDDVLGGVTTDHRIGGAYFNPGVGYGGSCLPKDVAALLHMGESAGVNLRLLSAVQATNTAQPVHAVNCIRQMLGSLEGKTIAVWGVTFKGGTDDLRSSPALTIVDMLRNEGARVTVYDPSLRRDARIGDEPVAHSALAAATNVSCVAVLTDWPEFADVDPFHLRDLMLGSAVYDGRNMLNQTAIEAAGLWYIGVGRMRHDGHDGGDASWSSVAVS